MPLSYLLKYRPLFEFETPSISGFIRPFGHMHGLVITHDAEGRPVTDPGKCFMNLEHYESGGRQGLFVPRDQCLHTCKVGDDWLEIEFSQTNDWKVKSSIVYQFKSKDTIDITFKFTFGDTYLKFEGFIASYMPPGTNPPWIKIDGKWIQPEVRLEVKEQLFIAREKKFLDVVNDQRWGILFARGYAYRVLNEFYDIPVMVTLPDKTLAESAIIQMIEPEQCFALSPNRFAPAHDFSIIGRDARAGETITVKARLIYRNVNSFHEVEQIYADFCTSQ